MNFVGYCNGALKKPKCAEDKRVEEITLPVAKNGFIYTGDREEYPASLLVIDIDGNVNLDHPTIKSLIENTMAVHTGGDGLHLYFQYAKELVCPKNERHEAKDMNIEILKCGTLKGLDVRGAGGKIFIPNSQFDGHKHPYRLLNDLEPTLIESEDEWLKIKHMFLAASKITKKDLTELLPSLLRKEDIIEIASRIIKNNDLHHGAHDFWLRFALYCHFLGFDAEDISAIYFIVAAHFDAFITKDIEADRLHAIEDACSGRYDKSVGAGIEEFFSAIDFKHIKSILARSSEKIKSILDEKEKEDLIKKYGDWALTNHMGYEETIRKLMYFHEIYHMNNNEVQKQIRLKMQADGLKTNQKLLQNVVRYIQDCAHHEFNDFDNLDTLLVVKNGIFNKEKRVLQDFDPKYLASIQYQFAFDATITTIDAAPKFKAFIESIDSDKNEQERLCYLLKYALENELLSRKGFIVFHGKKDSGKGICLKILQTLIGATYCMGISMHHAGNRFAGGDLLHKRLAFDSDASPDPWNPKTVSFLKKMTGMDLLRFEKKGCDAVTGKNTASLIILCNRVPMLNGSEEMGSITGRAYFKYFGKSHAITEDFEDFIEEEKDAIGSYLLNLAPKDISKVPDSVKISAEEYWKELSNPAYKWCKENIIESSSDEIVKQYEVTEQIASFLVSLKITPDLNYIRNEINFRLLQIGGTKLYKQISGERIIFLKNVAVVGCTSVSIAGLKADADYEHAKEKSIKSYESKIDLPEL